jgi:signal transduction histidine kinase
VSGGLTRRMVLASAALMVVVAGAFSVLVLAIDDQRDSARAARDTREELIVLDAVEKLVIDLETGLRGFVITRDERFLAPWDEARAALPARLRELERVVADNPRQSRRARQLATSVRQYITDYGVPLIAAARRNAPSARGVEVTDEGKRRVDALRAEFADLRGTERTLITEEQDRADAAARRAVAAAFSALAASIVLVFVFAGYLNRAIVRPVRRAAQMAGRLAAGDLSTRMPATGVDEIGELERSFNTMADSLEANEDELRRLLAQQSALRRVATLVAQRASPSDVFEVVTREVGMLSDADLARMERYEPDATVTGVASWSRDVDRLTVGTRFALEGVSIAALVRDAGRPVRVDSFADASGPIAAEARTLGIRSSVGCPIVVAGRLWGVIAASSKGEAPFPAGTEAQIGDFTELVATAIANAESRAELAERASEQAALRRVATLVARGASPADVFSAVAEELAQQLDAEITKILRFEADGTTTVVGGWSVPGMHIPLGTRLTVEREGLAWSVLQNRRPSRVERFEGPPGSIAACFANTGARSGVGSPIVVEDSLWGVAIAASSRANALAERSEERIAEFTEIVATAIANAESRAELAASRARVVAAADRTRRQLERDLHDGAQQRLVSLALRLRAAEAMIPPDLAQVHEELRTVGSGLDDVLDDLREISRGIHPAILAEGGLGPALRTLARRSSVPVELKLRADERLPERVEVAAYYVVSEALTNVAKHANASTVHVDVDATDGLVRLAIRDDGVGGADPNRGSGLIGLKDRVEATGGSMLVESRLGEGTSIVVELPSRAAPTHDPS